MAKSEIKMKMSLDSSGVKASLSKIKSDIGKFASEAKAKLKTVAKVGIGALVGGFAAASRSALIYGKEMQNLSKLANTGFKDFQKLAEGAKTVGVEQDKLADILKDTSDKIGDFLETGGGAMADYFENIAPLVGQTAEEFRNLSGPEALQKYYNGLEQANVSQETMTFYMEAIASDSTALVPLLRNGGEAFKDLGKAAEDGGRIMSENTAKHLAEASSTLDKFKQKATIWAADIITLLSGNVKFAQITPTDYGAVSERGLARQDEIEKIKELAAAYGELPDGTDLKALAEGLSDVATSQSTLLSTDFDPSKLKGGVKLIADASVEIDRQKKLLADGLIDLEQYNFEHQGILAILKAESIEMRKSERTEKEKAAIAKLTSKIAKEERDAELASVTNSEKLASLMAERAKLQQELTDGGNGSSEAELELIGHKLKVLELDREIIKTQKAADEDDAKAVKEANKQSDKGAQDARDQADDAADEREEAARAAEKLHDQSLQSDLLDAQIAQRDDIIQSVENEIELTERIKQIREETGKGEAEAREAAVAALKNEAGADTNQSGHITRREQRAFDKKQKKRAGEQKKRNREEERREREGGGELGGGEKDVVEERANSFKKRAQDRKNRRDKAEVDRRRRRGEDEDDVKAEIAKRDLDEDMRKAEKEGPEAVAKEVARRAGENKKPAKPKKPENEVVKKLEPIMKNQLTQLEKIATALECEG